MQKIKVKKSNIIVKNKTAISITIAKNIGRFREEAGITQKEAGMSLGFPEDGAQQRFYHYEINYRSPNKKTLEKIAKLFNKPIISFYSESYGVTLDPKLEQAMALFRDKVARYGSAGPHGSLGGARNIIMTILAMYGDYMTLEERNEIEAIMRPAQKKTVAK